MVIKEKCNQSDADAIAALYLLKLFVDLYALAYILTYA